MAASVFNTRLSALGMILAAALLCAFSANASTNDAPEDVAPVAGPETEPAGIEVEPVEAEPASTPLDAESIESGAID